MMKLARRIFWWPLKAFWKLCSFAALLAFILGPMVAWTDVIWQNWYFYFLEPWHRLFLSIAGNYIWLAVVFGTAKLMNSEISECKNADLGF